MNGADVRVEFDEVPWASAGAGARQKIVDRRGVRFRLLQLTPEFVEDGWCTRGHVGYVLEGELELQFAEKRVALRAGDGVCLRPGHEDAHRARAITPRVVLFLVDDR